MSRNNITGDALISKETTDKFRDGWDAIWNKPCRHEWDFCGENEDGTQADFQCRNCGALSFRTSGDLANGKW